MKMSNHQKSLVYDFFERIANAYHQNNQDRNGYHYHFFKERINDALSVIGDVSNLSILDVGAGTGSFYDSITNKAPVHKYTAIDLSPKMLAESRIPKQNQIVGDVLEIEFSKEQFDLIVFLGVSSYLSDNDLTHLFEKFNYWLEKNGRIIATFTNKHSLDYYVRALIRPLTRSIPSRKEKVINQGFSIKSYDFEEIKKILLNSLIPEKIIWQNQTVTPFNHLFPKLSSQLAQLLKRTLPDLFLPFFSSDFMVIFQKHP
jgi:ubiquinone/menaquinone biosynthesis C-methylase UbiE